MCRRRNEMRADRTNREKKKKEKCKWTVTINQRTKMAVHLVLLVKTQSVTKRYEPLYYSPERAMRHWNYIWLRARDLNPGKSFCLSHFYS